MSGMAEIFNEGHDIEGYFGDVMSNEKAIKKLCDNMARDGLKVESFKDAGGQAIILKLKGIEHGVLRIDPVRELNDKQEKEGVNFDPMDDSIALKPVLRKQYGDFIASVVPMCANATKGTIEDFLRTVSIVKQHGQIGHKNGKYFINFVDAARTQLSNLVDNNGKIMRMPSGAPIGFIHDLNAAISHGGDPNIMGWKGPNTWIESQVDELKKLDMPDLTDEGRKHIITSFRQISEKSTELPDDHAFVQYLKGIFNNGIPVSPEDAVAPAQQSIALDRLRTELKKLEGLAPEFKEQLKQRSQWELPERLSHRPSNPSPNGAGGHVERLKLAPQPNYIGL